ncbi:hypothetical protein CesoFtcFv8_005413 [Champsocephalus esox]|uniref:Uncharacterized protein n=2 Tax=Champsocephalus TaxID=52236 RepID=A0AAN8DZP0_CHAGU|nr:hypothetical protein CesoFtcFv8_005413 [Champsocephalus esox]KAK5931150.1 hypothetical protein CgunFtcFv8_027321 [Champsocephalus gunnari]
MAAHRDTDQSGLNGQNITSSAVHRSIRILAVESLLSGFAASSPEVSHKPLISRATSQQAPGHSQNLIPADRTIDDL